MGGVSFGVPEAAIIVAVFGMLLLVAWPAGRICRKAGFSPWLGILAVIPIANVILLWVVALADWPASRSARDSA